MKERSEYCQGMGMKTEFRFVEEYSCRHGRLHKSGCQTHEAQGAVGHLVGTKWIVGIPLEPLKLDVVRNGRDRAKLEVVEEGSNHSNGVADAFVVARISDAYPVEERCEVRGILA